MHDNTDVIDNIRIELYKKDTTFPITTITSSEPSYPGTLNNELSWTFPGSYEKGWYFLRFLNSSSEKIGQSGLFQILTIPAPPTFDPPGGTYPIAQNVYLNTSTDGAVIKYSTDNSAPTLDYTAPIPVTSTTKIKAKSVYTFPNNDKVESDTVEAIYHIDTFSDAVTVAIEGSGTSVSENSYQSHEINLGPGVRSYLSFTINGSTFPDGIDLQNLSLSILFFSNYNGNSFYIKGFNKPGFPVSSSPKAYFDSVGTGTQYERATITGSDFQVDYQAFVDEIKNILDNNLNKTVYLGLQNTDEQNSANRIYHKLNDPDKPVLKITYVPQYNFLLDQKDSGEDSFGQAEYWENSAWQQTPFVPFKDTKDFGAQVTLKADQDFKENTSELMNRWVDKNQSVTIINHATFSFDKNDNNRFLSYFETTTGNIVIRNLIEGLENVSDSDNKIYFKDPWLLDQTDLTYGDYNSGMSGGLKPFGSPFRVYENAAYRGIFKNQEPINNFYYSVKFPQTIPLAAGNVNFISWESTGTQQLNTPQLSGGFYETPVVFTADQAVVTANYKGVNLTGDAGTYSHNNQRRIAKTQDTTLHKVYESMGKVFYEISTDDGSTWTIMNNGQPLYSGNAKSPAIVADKIRVFNSVLISYQREGSNGNSEIVLHYYINNSHTPVYSQVITPQASLDYSYDLTPSLAMRKTDEIMLVYDVPYIPFYSENPGIHCWYGSVDLKDGTGFEPYISEVIPNSGSSSSYPAIVEEDNSPDLGTFHVVWQEGTSIKYTKIVGDWQPISLSYSGYYEVSSTLASWGNRRPTITEDNSPNYPNRFYVSWISEQVGTHIQEGAMRINTNGNWHVINYTYSMGGGENVETINANTNDTQAATIALGSSTTNGKFIWTNNPSSTRSIPYMGDVKVSNGSSLTDQRISILQKQSAPYSFAFHGQGGLQKSSEKQSPVTREVNLAVDGNRLFIQMGNILVNGKNIGITNEALDELPGEKTAMEFNDYLVTETFEINDKTDLEFIFGIQTENNTKPTLAGNKRIDVSVIMIDAETGRQIQELKNIKLKQIDSRDMLTKKYGVKAEDKQTRKVKLALVIDENLEAEMNLVTKVDYLPEGLPKGKTEEITIESLSVVKDYGLAQNYPNPFNPSTMIKYQIPVSGHVTLKVYDVLGKEVSTLINRKQDVGYYEVEFDGSTLASGMYIYKIDVQSADPSNHKNFSKVKKMLMIK